MKRYTVCDTYGLWWLCSKNKWFTCGDNEAYDRMFRMNADGEQIEKIAALIWRNSDVESYDKLLETLKEEQAKYLINIDESE